MPLGTGANETAANKSESAAIEADAEAASEADGSKPPIDPESYPDRIVINADSTQNQLRITLGRFWG